MAAAAGVASLHCAQARPFAGPAAQAPRGAVSLSEAPLGRPQIRLGVTAQGLRVSRACTDAERARGAPSMAHGAKPGQVVATADGTGNGIPAAGPGGAGSSTRVATPPPSTPSFLHSTAAAPGVASVASVPAPAVGPLESVEELERQWVDEEELEEMRRLEDEKGEGEAEEELFCHILDRPQKKHVCLFYCQEMEELAHRIAADTDNIELRSIKWRTFPDGYPDLFVPNARTARNRDVAFLASFSNPSVIFEQISIIYALPRMFVRSFTLVLPFFPTGTQERMEDEGDIATAVTLARILSNIPISRGGPTSVVIFDIHALQERFYFGDNVLPCFESAIPMLKNRLHDLPDADNIAIAFPDEGAWKRFHKALQHYPTVVCTKVREGKNRIVKLKEGDPAGKHVVIVDDLVQSGSTLIECQKVLAARGASRVSAFATHGVFPNRSWKRFTHDQGDASNGGFAYFWITDSCPATAELVHNHKPFEVLSLARPIQAALQV